MALYKGIELPNRPDPENIRKLDLLPLPQIARMMRVGVAIDPDWFNRLASEFETRKQDHKKEICSLIPEDALERFVSDSGDEPDINPESADQIAELLFSILKVDRKGVRLTKSGNRLSTGKKQLEQIKRRHPVIPKILQYRQVSKLKTFCVKIPTTAIWHPKGKDCPVCGRFHYSAHPRNHSQILTTRTAPGRLAMKKENLQQIPARTKDGREVRKGFVASEGCNIVTRDFGQLHLRLIADQANDPTMINIFQKGLDPHKETARKAFGLGPDQEPDKLTQRDPSKTVNFLIVYQGGAPTLLENLALNFSLANMEVPDWLTLEWCEWFISVWFQTYSGCKGFFDEWARRMMRWGVSWCPFGRVRRIPEIQSAHWRVREAGLRQGGNHPIIGAEAGMVKVAQARIEDRLTINRQEFGVDCEAIIPVHDELVLEVEEDWAEVVGEQVGEEMERCLVDEQTGVLQCRVPITTDGKISERWSKD